MRTLAFIALLTIIPARFVDAALSDAQRDAILGEAQAAYDRGASILPTEPVAAREAFRTAATRFQQLVDDGLRNGPLLYDLGNAYLQSGDLGRAILSYRAAQVYTPGDAPLLHNLEHARSLRRNRIAPSGERALRGALLGWHDRTAIGTRFSVFAVAWCGFWILLTVVRFRRVPGSGWIAGAAAALWLATGLSVAVDLVKGRPPVGVVTADETIVRKGNGDGFAPQFEEPLYPGVEFVLRDERPGWIEIELPNETTGWIPRDAAGLVAVR